MDMITFPLRCRSVLLTPGQLTDYQIKRRKARRTLEGAGLYQAVTYSLTSQEKASQFALEARESIRLAMPMSEERSQLRLSIVPQLLEVVKYNNARQIDSLALYEIGSVFFKRTNKNCLKKKNILLEQSPAYGSHIYGKVKRNQWISL